MTITWTGREVRDFLRHSAWTGEGLDAPGTRFVSEVLVFLARKVP